MLSLRGIEKSYPLAGSQLPVLKGIDLVIEQGEMVAIMGSSGSGKSTLLNVLGLLDGFEGGTYHLDDVDMSELTERQAARYRSRFLGFVFQSFNLIAFKSALENVALPLFYQKIPRRERQKRALTMLDRMGIADRASHLPSELSGGQKQRVAMARALITNPRVILADEPTGALDSVTSNEVMDVLREVNSTGISVIIVTHEADIAARCDRTIRLKDGRIIEDGNSTEVVEPTARGFTSDAS
ncbi:MAG: ABC transporter ATP-binding protein [Bacteroidetes bacterium]|jgi:putative ABC transport system ATP-binding protein|nr:ABC transporter ATP-binding protein [Bacteroidota bacterium]